MTSAGGYAALGRARPGPMTASRTGLPAETKRALTEARQDFVQGAPDPEDDAAVIFPTMAELSEKYRINPTLLRKICDKEDWHRSRELLLIRVQANRIAKRVKRNSAKALEVDDKVLRLGEIGIAVVHRQLIEMTKLIQIAARDEALQHQQGVPIPLKRSGIKIGDLSMLVRTLGELHKVMRAATGDPVPEQAYGEVPEVHIGILDAQAAPTPPEKLVRDVVRFYSELTAAEPSGQTVTSTVVPEQLAAPNGSGNGHGPG